MASSGTSIKRPDIREFAATYKNTLQKAIETIAPASVDQAIQILAEARADGHTIFVCGNGGSASTASHFASDLLKGASFQRQLRFRILALTDSLPTLTAYSNDVNYDCIFTEQLRNLARPGDIVVAISASGNSANVLQAVEYARSSGCRTIALTGRDGGRLGPLADLEVRVAEIHMGRIEDSHMAICHMISFYFMECA